MQQLPQPPRRGTVWRRHVLALVGAALLAGCANGDFQEVRPTLVRDDIHDWVGLDAIAGRATSPSRYQLTDDERTLRDLAYPLIEPPYDRQQWYSIAGEYGLIRYDRRGAFDRTAYSNRLMGSHYRSPSARYARLTDDIRNDATRLPQFFETAARVLDIDAKRRKSLAFVSRLTPDERENALRRMRENAAIVALVRRTLAQRVAGYRFALERLVIATPSAQAAGVERDLNQLRAQIAYYRTHRAPTWVREQSLASAR
jgi:hypothetical protein